MTIASVAARGTGVTAGTAATTCTQTPGAAVSAGAILITYVTSAGTNPVSSIADDAGNAWTFLAGYTNATNGNIRTEVWMCRVAFALSSTTVITCTFSAANADVCIASREFSVSSGKTLRLSTTAVTSEVNAANGFGSSAFSGLASASRLYLRVAGKRANSTTAITASTNFTSHALTVRSQNNATASILRAEERINTSTGETSNPTLAVSGNTAGLFVALEEVTYSNGDRGFSGVYGSALKHAWLNTFGITTAGGFLQVPHWADEIGTANQGGNSTATPSATASSTPTGDLAVSIPSGLSTGGMSASFALTGATCLQIALNFYLSSTSGTVYPLFILDCTNGGGGKLTGSVTSGVLTIDTTGDTVTSAVGVGFHRLVVDVNTSDLLARVYLDGSYIGSAAYTSPVATIGAILSHGNSNTGTLAFKVGQVVVASKTSGQFTTGTDALAADAVLAAYLFQPITATGSTVVPAPTVSGAATARVSAAGASSVATPTVSGSAALVVAGAGSTSIPAPTVASSAAASVAAAGATSVAAPTVASSGAVAGSAAGATTVAAPTTAVAAAVSPGASGATTVAAPTTTGTSSSTIVATCATSVAAPTVSATAQGALVASGATQVAAPTATGTCSAAVAGTCATTVAAPTVASSGAVAGSAAGATTVAAPTVAGAAAVSIGASGATQVAAPTTVAGLGVGVGAAGATHVAAPTVDAALAGALLGAGAPTVGGPTTAATGSSEIGAQIAATVDAPTTTGAGAVVVVADGVAAVPAPTVTATGTVEALDGTIVAMAVVRVDAPTVAATALVATGAAALLELDAPTVAATASVPLVASGATQVAAPTTTATAGGQVSAAAALQVDGPTVVATGAGAVLVDVVAAVPDPTVTATASGRAVVHVPTHFACVFSRTKDVASVFSRTVVAAAVHARSRDVADVSSRTLAASLVSSRTVQRAGVVSDAV